MVKLEHPEAPEYWTERYQNWQQELDDAVVEYGGYSNIPKREKSKLIGRNNHESVKTVLFASSYHK